jgi:hypothetical protein
VLQFTNDEVLEADRRLNKYFLFFTARLLFQSVGFAAFGLANGALLSIFFKRKVPVIAYASGLGLGVAVHHNANQLIKHIRAQQ